MKKYSIITISYKNCDGLKKTIESVINQTCRDFEFIVIDGGSNDGSAELLMAYNSQIDYWVSEPDQGIYHAMNKGIARAGGEYCIFMNSADSFHNDYVLEEIEKQHYTADIITGRRMAADRNIPMIDLGKEGINMRLFLTNTLGHQSSFIRRNLFEIYPYDENYRIVSDWKFFIQALILGNASFQFTDIFVADMDMTGISSNHHQLSKNERDNVLKELFPARMLEELQLLKEIGESPLLKLIPYLNQTTRFHQIIYQLVNLIVKSHLLLKRLVNKS